jgi:hypothetical protein
VSPGGNLALAQAKPTLKELLQQGYEIKTHSFMPIEGGFHMLFVQKQKSAATCILPPRTGLEGFGGAVCIMFN